MEKYPFACVERKMESDGLQVWLGAIEREKFSESRSETISRGMDWMVVVARGSGSGLAEGKGRYSCENSISLVCEDKSTQFV